MASPFVGVFYCDLVHVRSQLTGSFYRVAIPQDITSGNPDPNNWGQPIAALSPENCDIGSYFYNHNIIFGMFCLAIVRSQCLPCW
jgi:hypothetical protein